MCSCAASLSSICLFIGLLINTVVEFKRGETTFFNRSIMVSLVYGG